MRKQRNDFLLPDDLGWECNDELQACIDDWLEESAQYVGKIPSSVIKAQLIDNMYSIIKRYQVNNKEIKA